MSYYISHGYYFIYSLDWIKSLAFVKSCSPIRISFAIFYIYQIHYIFSIVQCGLSIIFGNIYFFYLYVSNYKIPNTWCLLMFLIETTFERIYYDIIVVTYCTISILCVLELCLPTESETESDRIIYQETVFLELEYCVINI